MKPSIENILEFVSEYSGEKGLNKNSDIEGELRVHGDDWHEMIEKFGKKYQVDMTTYLWYFHSSEEGFNIGNLFFLAPYDRVERIPVTPQDLFRIATNQIWDFEYPEHELPKRRYDLLIGATVFIILITVWVAYGLK